MSTAVPHSVQMSLPVNIYLFIYSTIITQVFNKVLLCFHTPDMCLHLFSWLHLMHLISQDYIFKCICLLKLFAALL